jgi:hypothetical protein
MSRARSGFPAPPLTANAARTGNATGREQNGSHTTIARTTQLMGESEFDLPCRGPVVEPARRVNVAAPSTEQGVIDRDRDRRTSRK